MDEQNWIEDGWIFHNHAWHLLHEIIKLIPQNTKTLLDSGGGTGLAAAVIKAIFPEIEMHVTDISGNSFPFWKRRKLFGYIVDSEKHPFDDNRFDFAMSSHVLEHTKNPELYISELVRVCGKRAVIVVPDGDVNFYDHKTIFDRSVFLEMLNDALPLSGVRIKIFPVYHPHINNLVAVIDK